MTHKAAGYPVGLSDPGVGLGDATPAYTVGLSDETTS
jgi:hypothetical protein